MTMMMMMYKYDYLYIIIVRTVFKNIHSMKRFLSSFHVQFALRTVLSVCAKLNCVSNMPHARNSTSTHPRELIVRTHVSDKEGLGYSTVGPFSNFTRRYAVKSSRDIP